MHIDQSIGTSTTAAVVTETGDFDTSAAGTIHVALAFMAGGLSMAASDVATIFSLDAAGPTAEAAIQIFNDAGTIVLRGGDGTTWRTTPLTQGRWYWLELSCLIDSGPNDGTIDFYVDGVQVGAQITSVDQGAITQARLGAHTITGCAGGHLLFGPVLADDARVGFYYPRYPRQFTFTKSSHVFVGPGSITGAALLSTGASNILRLFDTDTGYTTAEQNLVAEMNINSQTSIGGPSITFQRGCFAQLSGTNPRGQIFVEYEENRAIGRPGPIYYNDAGMKNYAHVRTARPGNT